MVFRFVWERVTVLHSQLDNLHQQMKEIQGEIGKPFPQEAELQQKSARLAELNAQFRMPLAESLSKFIPSQLSKMASSMAHLHSARVLSDARY